MRSAVDQASKAATNAGNTSANLGAEASGIGSTLTPFLTSELEHPQGYSQGDTSAMLSAGMGAAGGANAGIVGEAAQRAGASRNAGGFQAALDDAARQRMKANAGTAEGIAASNAGVKLGQQQDAARGLQGMYGTDTSGMLQASGQIAPDVNAEVNADKTGWLQNAQGLLGTGLKVAGGFGIPGFSGFKGSNG
jgi:hypothetical protein